MPRMLCFIFGHDWLKIRGYSSGRWFRICRECKKQEKLMLESLIVFTKYIYNNGEF